MEPASRISNQSVAVAPQQSAPTAPISALVITADERFHQRAEGVLGSVGAISAALTSPGDLDIADLAWLVAKARANVVVLDATDCEIDVSRSVSSLAASHPRLGVVVVCEHLTHAAGELGALPKWGWTRALRVAVHHAQIDGSPLVTTSRQRLHATRRDLRGVATGSTARR